MGLLVGLVLGIGAFLILLAAGDDGAHRPRRVRRSLLAESIAASGMAGVTPRGLAATCVALAAVVGVSFVVLTATWPVSLAFALIAGAVPIVLVRQRAQRRRAEMRELWPDVVDNLASAVRAGMSLPDAIALVSRTPAERVGLDDRGEIAIGKRADLVRFRLNDDMPEIIEVWRKGDRVA